MVEEDDYEALPDSAPFIIQLAAGSLAGVAEHSIMYPFDSVKTRLQTGATGPPPSNRPPIIEHHCGAHRSVPLLPKTVKVSGSVKATSESLVSILVRMWQVEGPFALTRGLSAAVAGAAPAHALYYTTYERSKTFFHNQIKSNSPLAAPIAQALAGCCATVMHDAVMNPAEVIKQRMQLCSPAGKVSVAATSMSSSPLCHHQPSTTNSAPNYQQLRMNHHLPAQKPTIACPAPQSYSGCIDCAIKTVRKEGIVAFYRSYPTQLGMNVPFQAAHFVIYETVLKWLNPAKEYNPLYHSVAGACGGAFAAALTTPLDVCKTLLNTQWCVKLHPELLKQNHIKADAPLPGIRAAVRAIYDCFGLKGFFRGATARMVIQAPSTAISWTVYEFFKHHLVPSEGETNFCVPQNTREICLEQSKAEASCKLLKMIMH